VGVYFQNIAKDPLTSFAAIPYDQAQDQGYFKIDFLNIGVLSQFESKEQMNELLEKEPNWKLLEEREVVEKLWHLSNQFEIVYAVKPKSIVELADVVAMIRPNKSKLLNKYLHNKKDARKELYTIREGSDMKKSHAVAYALLIVIQLHLIAMGKL
jgi:DNA polymerase III alpha subunit